MTDFSAKRFGFVMYDGFEELDLIGPWEMIAMWSAYAGGPGELVTVAETVRPIRCDKGLTCLPDHDFQSCPPLDYLLVPGGFILPVQEKVSPGLVAFIADRGARAEAVLSVCSGTFLLHAAGLLSGRRAATNWKALAFLESLGDVQVVEERWTRDGAIWSSAGVSAGMDMALAFIAELAGEAAASTTQLNAEYFPDGRIYGDAVENAVRTPTYFKTLRR